MKLIIWAVAIAICSVPLRWLWKRNRRAVPVGVLIMAFVGVGGLGALAFGGALYLGTLAVFVGLIAVNLYLMKGSLVERAAWAAGSQLIWMFVFFVCSIAYDQTQLITMDERGQVVQEQARQAELEIQRRRADLDLTPEYRREVIDSVLPEVRAWMAKSYETIERLLVFGDPAKAPGDVVVWCVLTIRPGFNLPQWGYYGERAHDLLNRRLRERGYPANISLGIAQTADVSAAGGDAAYFGKAGSKVIPQYLPDYRVGTTPLLAVPRRRE